MWLMRAWGSGIETPLPGDIQPDIQNRHPTPHTSIDSNDGMLDFERSMSSLEQDRDTAAMGSRTPSASTGTGTPRPPIAASERRPRPRNGRSFAGRRANALP